MPILQPSCHEHLAEMHTWARYVGIVLIMQRKVGVPWLAVAAAVPIALGVVGAVRLSAPWSIVSLAVGILAYVVLQQFVVPLVGRDA